MFSLESDRNKLLVAAVGASATLFFFIYLSQTGYLTQSLMQLAALGWIGNFIFIMIYLVASFPVPMGTSPLILIAGFLYGVIVGFITITIGSMVGAALSFVVCRKMLSHWVDQNIIQRRQFLVTMLKAIERHAFKICFLIRMAPIPFGVQNAMFGISRMQFNQYMVATGVGLVPEHLLLVYFGSTTKHLSDLLYGSDTHGHSYERLFVASQIVVCVILLGIVIRIGRKAFNEVLKEEQKEHDEGEREEPTSFSLIDLLKSQPSSRVVQIRLDQ